MREMPRGFNKKPADIRKEMVEAMKPKNIQKTNIPGKPVKQTPQELFRINQNIKRGLK